MLGLSFVEAALIERLFFRRELNNENHTNIHINNTCWGMFIQLYAQRGNAGY